MNPLDAMVFGTYLLVMLGVGIWFLRRNESADDYYVAGRGMGSTHVGMSMVATDVGGGFSIGLGGLGFAMGMSGSWMLFTGLLGAWLSAVLLIPRIKRDRSFDRALTFPEVFGRFFGPRTALLGGIISAVGYVGFTAAQILAGAKLATGTFPALSLQGALWLMGAVAIGYTVLGGLKAVIYTDTIQWAILIVGLTLVGIPVAYQAVGGMSAIRDTLRPEMLSLTNVSTVELVNWGVTIVPIWFVGMTLYQRIYSCRDERTARRAWYVAGLLEWPVMAFMGVTLGLLARVAADQGMFAEWGMDAIAEVDPETGLPLLLRTVLPAGAMGLVLSAYFSAILSTADSCLMACSGNVVSDILRKPHDDPGFLRRAQVVTLALGVFALLLASRMTSVLDLMLLSYAFMVSGLLVPVLVILLRLPRDGVAAAACIVVGGSVTSALVAMKWELPLGLDANVFGIAASALTYALVRLARRGAPTTP
ncbi:MAG TPA: sodium:solute symporter family protein [bacterium]|nr:sodium:solute symporter family protein [bacterium]